MINNFKNKFLAILFIFITLIFVFFTTSFGAVVVPVSGDENYSITFPNEPEGDYFYYAFLDAFPDYNGINYFVIVTTEPLYFSHIDSNYARFGCNGKILSYQNSSLNYSSNKESVIAELQSIINESWSSKNLDSIALGRGLGYVPRCFKN